MNSGSAVPTLPVDHPKPQAIYDQVVLSAGCKGKSDTLKCLRSVSYETLLNAISSLPGILSYNALNLAYLPRPDPASDFYSISPEEAATLPQPEGVPYVPIIIGDQEDEGNLFALLLSNVTTGKLTDYFASYFPDTPRETVAGLVDLYPDDAAAGSPFNTGKDNELYPGYKKNAAVLGDAVFTLSRRAYLSLIQPRTKSWSYIASYFNGVPLVGTTHGTDLIALFFGLNADAANSILPYYISFFNYLDPNRLGGTNWPQWTDEGRDIVAFNESGKVTTIKDNFREEAYQYLLEHSSELKV